jgi:hypothetical protein
MLRKYIQLCKRHWKVQVPLVFLAFLMSLKIVGKLDGTEFGIFITSFTAFWQIFLDSIKPKKK